MGNPEQDGTEGMDPTVEKISEAMEGLAGQLFGKPRRERDQNRKVDRNRFYGKDGTTPE